MMQLNPRRCSHGYAMPCPYSPAWLRWLHWCCTIPVNQKYFCHSVSFPRVIRIFYGSFKHFLKTNNGFNRNVAILLMFDWGRCSLMPWASSGESGTWGHQVKESNVAMQVAGKGQHWLRIQKSQGHKICLLLQHWEEKNAASCRKASQGSLISKGF